MRVSVSIVLAFLSGFLTRAGGKQPNIVFILTDDQDVALNGQEPMPKTRRLIGDAGVTFENMFVTSPLCCPSRSSILTGKYSHNHGAVNNSLGGGCSSSSWQQQSEQGRTLATYLRSLGYSTFFAGKYLNEYGSPSVGGVSHVPPGWTSWNGLLFNSVYYNYTLSVDGKAEVHGDNYSEDYLTDVIASKALQFLSDTSQSKQPFFMMLATPACHDPFTPAPQYRAAFPNVTAPRDGSFNIAGKDKHWLVRAAEWPLSSVSLTYIDYAFRNRWRTLLSVDDLVEKVVQQLLQMDVLNETYVFFSSDNGFHLGQFALPNDKRQLYEFDVRVPFMARGPGIMPGTKLMNPVLNIDLAPTFLDLAGISAIPDDMDGLSMAPLLTAGCSSASVADCQPLRGLLKHRTDFLVEHSGEHEDVVSECPRLNDQDVYNCYPSCVCEDARNNTYLCVRRLTEADSLMYCEFDDSEGFIEVYNMTADPNQLTNIANSINPQVKASLAKSLAHLALCSGAACNQYAQVALW